ncbi:hypothetical protein [Truepera radiovictrix]|uniref:Uncharacterized protein n=1 Tax=Truepera radiovictrix (strain DSM 17093 / CIP 108686 / LMG 22925 / RQ-24) TaxID=649638 RepID=D7CWW5_TRURR|nr:hypothetical protein [Truepera radiovictrix]ADI14473.1 hypothetical protein Trad_1351 [Truepera radiovictrix DSM 17093]WMT56972.1 hypothetical protein RCV51_13255 [Truepera radiovictrix]
MNRCYLVELKPSQRHQLPPDVLSLATCLRGEGGEWLLFRDNLVAYKVAKLTGGTVRCGQMLASAASPDPAPRKAARHGATPPKRTAGHHTLTLEGGIEVRLDAPVAAG